MAKKRKVPPAEGKLFVPQKGDELIPAEDQNNAFRIRRRDRAMAEKIRALHEQQMGLHWKRFEEGDTSHLLWGIDLCLRTGRAAPELFATEFCNRFVRWATHQVQTLDEAFGVQRPAGQHFQELKKRYGLRPSILLRVLHVQRTKNLPIDDEIFAIVGKQLGVKTRYVRDIWYDKESKALRALFRTAEKITLA
jgi:hypothetical protein